MLYVTFKKFKVITPSFKKLLWWNIHSVVSQFFVSLVSTVFLNALTTYFMRLDSIILIMRMSPNKYAFFKEGLPKNRGVMAV